jgi:cellulose synthase (UDP-forming)
MLLLQRATFGLVCLAALVVIAFAVAIPLDLRGQAIFGATTIVVTLALNTRGSRRVTIAMGLLSIAVTTRYLYWRTTETLHFRSPVEAAFGLGLYLAELYAWAILVLGYVQTVWPLERPVRPLAGEADTWPTVDVFIPTYNESLQIVQDTVLAALSMDYPRDRFRVYLLDDGRRPEFKAFAEAAGAFYIARTDNKHAKAGNLNNALGLTDGELVCIFDADHIPTRAFLQVTVGWFQADPRLALLQTPHHFYSPDPVQRNLRTVKDVPDEGALFYGVVQPGNDFWNAAFFCGSCAVIRREALNETRGFAGETVTEDAHTALKLQRRGWNSAYLDIRLASGLATERLALHIGQRARWARGMIQIFRVDNPLFGPGLSLAQRLCYLNAMLHFFFPLPRIVFLTSPLAFLLFGQNIIFASAPMIAAFAVPHLVQSITTSNRIQGQDRRAFWGEVYESLLAFHLVVPTFVTLLNPKRGKFNVTDKGGLLDKGYFDARLMWPHMVVMGLLVLGLAAGVAKLLVGGFGVNLGTLLLNASWTLFSLLILSTALAVGRETRQMRAYVRVGAHLPVILKFGDGREVRAVTDEISMGGFAVSKIGPIDRTQAIDVQLLCGAQWTAFPARIASVTGETLRVQFKPMPIARHRELVVAVMGRADAWQPHGAPPSANPIASLIDLMRASASLIFWWSVKQPEPYAQRPVVSEEEAAKTASVLCAVLACLALFAGPPPAKAQAQNQALQAPLRPEGQVQVQAPISPPAAQAEPVAVGGVREVTITLGDMGVRRPARLLGVNGEAGIPFTLRRDEVVTGASLVLNFAYSPALLPDLSQLNVLINDEAVASIPLTREGAKGTQVEIPVEPALFLTDNRLNLRFVGHYTRGCEDPRHSSLWVNVSNLRSSLKLRLQRLPLRPDLNQLPAPFFDGGNGTLTPLTLPFVFASPPSDDALRAAAAAASYFGMAAAYHGARFPALIGGLPTGEAVVFATADDRVEGLDLPAINGPTLAVVANPRDPSSALLLVLGRDPAELRDAALTLAVGAKGLAGPVAVLGAPSLATRQPYDAPRWLRTDRKVRLGEVVDPAILQTVGLPPGPVNAAFRVSPDLFLWPRTGAPMALRYRYPTGPWLNREESRLDVSLNGRYLKSFKLDHQRGADGLRGRLLHGFRLNDQDLSLPPYQLFGQNELQFYFDLKGHTTAACQGQQPTNVRSGIDPDTTIDLTGGHHYTQLPNLAFFASAGFPFTRMADLSKTAVVLAPSPSLNEIEAFLDLMGRFGDATGAPVTRVRIVRNGDAAALRDHDVLLIGPTSLLTGDARLMKAAPFSVDGSRLRLRLAGFRDRVFSMLGTPLDNGDREAASDILVSAESFSGMTSFRSPFGGDRVVVALISDRTDQLPALVQRLADPIQNAEVKGDLVIEADNTLSSFRVGSTFWAGTMPHLYRAAWWLSLHPVLMALALAGAAVVLAGPIFLLLRARERRRLKGGEEL